MVKQILNIGKLNENNLLLTDLISLWRLSLKNSINYFKAYSNKNEFICNDLQHFPHLNNLLNFNLSINKTVWFSPEFLEKLADVSLKYACGLISFSSFEKKISILAVDNKNYNYIWESFYKKIKVAEESDNSGYLLPVFNCYTEGNKKLEKLSEKLVTLKTQHLPQKNLKIEYVINWQVCSEFLAFSDIVLMNKNAEEKNSCIDIWIGGRRDFYLEPLEVFLWKKNLLFINEENYLKIKYLIEDILAWWIIKAEEDEYLAETITRVGREIFISDLQ